MTTDPVRRQNPALRAARTVWLAVAPMVFGVLLFTAGGVMLVSTVTPDSAARVRRLSALAPPGLVDLSHFVASLAAVALLFLAFAVGGAFRRGYLAAQVVLIAAAVATLAKGLNIDEAAFLATLAVLLYFSRGAFYRRAPLRTAPLSFGALAGIGLALAAAGWLGLFAYDHVAYRNELWWTFLTDGGAPRFLRGAVGAAVFAVAVIAWRFSRAPTPTAATPADLQAVTRILAAAENATPDANLAYLGDKAFVFSDSGESFIQYAAHGGAWVAMSEPVGPLRERTQMIWAFRDQCDRAGASPVFYAVRRDSLADFIDCGLTASKIGENAVVDLSPFSLEGSDRSGLRQALSRGQRDGLTFDVIDPEGFSQIVGDLRVISDAWLAIHHGREKSFSLGRFDPEYLARFPTAVIRREGRIVAFANLWRTADKRTVSVDLMRYGADAPKGVMELLFVHLMLWAKADGFARFDMGMAPLAGLDDHRLARVVTRVGALVYAHGGGVYGFDGLRAFKNKFRPRWEPSYIAAPHSWSLAPGLSDAALLSSGGLRGLLR
ncbi:MAG: DUF2156 domain-containing protein [Alphaproteobacteria bacterium]|nr:DUF2156 domain-containing protein [Alphaproteobacteria bacterium]MBU1516776.1 DUF2156 domain-containing protein [Alphaproteobacteria bacterium]MBU2092470.1 DUF2156 domain-containing protein [Alphaproteobacteria bacterium]MBU2152399.1 DUF2156 domain-containing protein [Alphaproteobacteria bacterium]MBU2305610.1 DUF2156 domain-containing protein [Alphaproteobacteria bacterium]